MRLRLLLEPNQGGSYEQFREIAVAAEKAGLDGFFRSDHLLGIDPRRAFQATEAWTTLAGLARETRRIRLGALVTAGTFRHPAMLAASVAVVDQISGGRVDFAIGAGWMAEEHLAFGLDFPAIGERFDRLEEQMEIITGLWETPAGRPFTHIGKHFTLVNDGSLPRTAQTPRPPIIIGGAGRRRTPALAARFADEFNLSFPTGLVERMRNFERIAGECGRDPATVRKSVILPVACGESPSEIARRETAIGAPPLLAEAAIGNAQSVAERVAQLGEQGVDTVYFHVYDINDIEHVYLLGADVASKL